MINEVYFLDYHNNLIEGNKQNCRRIVEELLSKKIDLKEIYVDLFQRSLSTIGKNWEKNKLSVADEHAATHITEELVNICYLKSKHAKTNGKKAIIACIDKEFHELGSKMASHVFEMNGWETTFLGASTPTRDLIKFIKLKNPDVVGLSYNFYMNLLRLQEVINNIKKFFPTQIIYVGGGGLQKLKKELITQFKDLYIFESIYELDNQLKKIK